MATLTKREMIERDVPIYAKSFNCSLEEARRDVESEYNATETDTDAFYVRLEDFKSPMDYAHEEGHDWADPADVKNDSFDDDDRSERAFDPELKNV